MCDNLQGSVYATKVCYLFNYKCELECAAGYSGPDFLHL